MMLMMPIKLLLLLHALHHHEQDTSHAYTWYSEIKMGSSKNPNMRKTIRIQKLNHTKKDQIQQRAHSKWMKFYRTFPSLLPMHQNTHHTKYIELRSIGSTLLICFFDVRWILRSTFTIHTSFWWSLKQKIGWSCHCYCHRCCCWCYCCCCLFSLHLWVVNVCIVCTKYRRV